MKETPGEGYHVCANVRVLACFVAGVSVVTMSAGTGPASDSLQGLLFHADFDQGLNATFSKGSPKAEAPGAVLVEGWHGKAVAVRGEGSSCRFETAGNLRPEQGTVMMWVKPLDWDASDDQFRHFWGVGAPGGGVLSLYRFHGRGNLLWLVGNSKQNRYGIAEFPISNWKAGEWHHLAATWERNRFGDGHIALFLDGWCVVGWFVPRDIYPTTVGDHFAVGTPGQGLYEDSIKATAIDELLIFDHALALSDVQRTFEAQGGDVRAFLSLPKAPRLPSAPGRGLGYPKRVPPPWTPLRVRNVERGTRMSPDRKSEIAVSCWGREYRFGASGLPEQITSAGASLLARPVSMKASVAGERVRWRGMPLRLLAASDLEATFEGRRHGPGVALTTRVKAEFDGLVRFDVELQPRSTDVRLDRLCLETPLCWEHARYLHACNGTFWETWAGATPEAGWRSAFYPFVWLGDEDRGLCWFAESNADLCLAKADDALAIERQGDVALLRVTFVNVPVRLRTPLRITFGFHATPVKPLPKGWRRLRMTDALFPVYPTPQPQGPGNLGVIWTGHPLTKWFGYPRAADESVLKGHIARLHAGGRRALPYWNLNHLSAGAPAWREYGLLWTTLGGGDFTSSDVRAHGHPFMGVCPAAPGWADFILGRLNEALDRYDADGFYQDGFSVGACDNFRHGCGSRQGAETGQSVGVWGYGRVGVAIPFLRTPILPHPHTPTRYYPIFAARELFKRAYVIVKGKKPNGFIIGHMSGSLQIPVLSFADAYLDGEHKTSGWYRLNGRMVSGDWLHGRLPLDTLRAEYMGRQFGVIPFFLPGFYGDPKRPEDTAHMMARLLLHDITPWDVHCHRETVHRIWQVLDEFGVEEAKFLGYWSEDLPVRAAAPCLVSVYQKRKGLLAILANLEGAVTEATLSLDWRRLGLRPAVQLRDALTGEAFQVTGNSARVRVERESFRLLVCL